GKEGCVDEVLSVVSMLSEASALFFRPKDKKEHADAARARFAVPDGGDHAALLNIWTQWAETDFSPVWARENFLQQRSLTRARDRTTVYVHPSSYGNGQEPPPLTLIYHELVLTSREYMRSCLPIDGRWLAELAPHYFKKGDMETLEARKMPKSRR